MKVCFPILSRLQRIHIILHVVTDLYILLFDAILANPDKVGHGREGYFFAENGEHVWYDICKEITKSLFEFGHGNSDEPTALTSEECLKFFGTEVREHDYEQCYYCLLKRSY